MRFVDTRPAGVRGDDRDLVHPSPNTNPTLPPFDTRCRGAQVRWKRVRRAGYACMFARNTRVFWRAGAPTKARSFRYDAAAMRCRDADARSLIIEPHSALPRQPRGAARADMLSSRRDAAAVQQRQQRRYARRPRSLPDGACRLIAPARRAKQMPAQDVQRS